MHTLTKKDFIIPKRKHTSHKGQNGTVLIIGGSEDYTGSLILAGLAALRCGADIVVIAAPEKVAWAINAYTPDLITKKVKGKNLEVQHFDQLKALAKRFDVVLFGNGMGLDNSTQKLCKKLALLPNNKVIDADGIKAISTKGVQNAIITPNEREMRLFLKNSDVKAAATKNISRYAYDVQKTMPKFFKSNNVLLVKGATDAIISVSKIALNKTGNQGMTRGGTGDVLAGLCAGYYAQLKNPYSAACNAAFMSGTVGDILKKKKKGYVFLASDVVEELRKIKKKK